MDGAVCLGLEGVVIDVGGEAENMLGRPVVVAVAYMLGSKQAVDTVEADWVVVDRLSED